MDSKSQIDVSVSVLQIRDKHPESEIFLPGSRVKKAPDPGSRVKKISDPEPHRRI